MKKRDEYFKFYPDAWLGDEKLALCRFATKGAWVDLICHMHKCDPYGYLIVNGIVLNKEDIKKMLHLDSQKHFDIIWGELLKYGIIKQNKKTGAFYSKKLLMEYEKDVSDRDGVIDDVPKATKILKRFNDVVDKQYQTDPKNWFMLNVVHSWFKNYEEVETYFRVIEYVYDKWKDDQNMTDFIKPTVFFGKNFPKYVAESINYKIKKKAPKVDFGGSAGFDEYVENKRIKENR